jgi:hypothetical protein
LSFSENVLVGALRRGEVGLPAGQVGKRFIDPDDIADAAVAALNGGPHFQFTPALFAVAQGAVVRSLARRTLPADAGTAWRYSLRLRLHCG